MNQLTDNDWESLRQLRDLFLDEEPIPQPYWKSAQHLAAYDATLAQRIGWKWDAVIKELKTRGWKPPATGLYDFGCGTGIATRRFLAAFGDAIESVSLFDHSQHAVRFARDRIREEFPHIRLREGESKDKLQGVVLVSHVLTELTEHALSGIVDRLGQADSVLWVEPGTRVCSRTLIAVREKMRASFSVSAPCPHQGACGLLTPENEPHWCHHFADTPGFVHQDPFWGRFRRELNLDLSSVAYSFLVLDKQVNPANAPANLSHQIGRPIKAPKFARLLSCQEQDVAELVISRRSGPDLYQDVKKGKGIGLFLFERRKNRIVGGRRV